MSLLFFQNSLTMSCSLREIFSSVFFLLLSTASWLGRLSGAIFFLHRRYFRPFFFFRAVHEFIFFPNHLHQPRCRDVHLLFPFPFLGGNDLTDLSPVSPSEFPGWLGCGRITTLWLIPTPSFFWFFLPFFY